MCIARVGRVLGAAKGRATVEFFDGRTLGEVDLSVVGAKEGDFVEVFGNLALSILTQSEARSRKRAWAEVRKASLTAQAEVYGP
jgi:hydrogenase maturation factor